MANWINPEQSMTRRAFLKLDSWRSKNQQEEDGTIVPEVVNGLAEYGTEAAVLLVAIQLALDAQQDKLYTMDIRPAERIRDLPGQAETYASIARDALRFFPETSLASAELGSTWRDRYYKSRTEAYTTTEIRCTGSGNSRTCVPVTVVKTRVVCCGVP